MTARHSAICCLYPPGAAYENSVANLRAAIADAKIESDELPNVVNATQLSQVFQNLIQTGYNYRGEARPEICASPDKRDGFCHFLVEDNGPGISPNTTR